MALEADLIDSTDFSGISICYHEGWDVLNNLGASADDGIAANSAKLMNSGEAPNDGVIFHDHVSGNSPVV
jgi:hypothetical protein